MTADLVPAEIAASNTEAGASGQDAARDSDLTTLSNQHALASTGRGVCVFSRTRY